MIINKFKMIIREYKIIEKIMIILIEIERDIHRRWHRLKKEKYQINNLNIIQQLRITKAKL